jgi:4-aminobutyrate aminotransferase/diaminobutyrate-pyruvate transaminase/4-aminobutyrate aminotransferase/(S)-3-amino-2-methylpropionate transaminase
MNNDQSMPSGASANMPKPKQSEDYIKMLEKHEASAVRFLENIVWDTAKDCWVTDVDGVRRLDFSSGAMITASGHGNEAIINAIKKQLDSGVYTSYLFPNKARCELHELLATILPQGYQSVFMNTGSEAIETALKVARIHAVKKLNNKGLVVSFNNSYHGKMMASTAIGGSDKIKYWIPEAVQKALSVQVPFPNCEYEPKRYSFAETLRHIKAKGVDLKDVGAFFIEPYQGGSCSFIPSDYAAAMQRWCQQNNVLIVCDEVQSGIARTGKMWGYEHLGITPDIIVAGKGLSASLPLSAVCAPKELFDLCEAGNFNTTHSGNPICCAAAVANLSYVLENNLTQKAEAMGKVLRSELETIRSKYPDFIKHILGEGLAYAIHLNVKYKDLLKIFLQTMIKNGLLVISPGGVAGTTFKLVPPLIIDADGIRLGCAIIDRSIAEVLNRG